MARLVMGGGWGCWQGRLPLMIFWMSARMLGPSKGWRCVASSYSTTPRDHTSLCAGEGAAPPSQQPRLPPGFPAGRCPAPVVWAQQPQPGGSSSLVPPSASPRARLPFGCSACSGRSRATGSRACPPRWRPAGRCWTAPAAAAAARACGAGRCGCRQLARGGRRAVRRRWAGLRQTKYSELASDCCWVAAASWLPPRSWPHRLAAAAQMPHFADPEVAKLKQAAS
jgi:hypothetical protein